MVLYPVVYSRQELHLNAYASIMQGLCMQVIIPALFHAATRTDLINHRKEFTFSLHFTQIKYYTQSKNNMMSV
jgi:hypothetical protein